MPGTNDVEMLRTALLEAEQELCNLGHELANEGWDLATTGRTLDVIRIAKCGHCYGPAQRCALRSTYISITGLRFDTASPQFQPRTVDWIIRAPFFLTGEGEPFAFTRRVTAAGAISYSCESLTEIFRRLHQQAGITNGNASSARRTFAVMLHRQGRSPKLIQDLIGVSSLSAVKRLVESDPVRLAAIVSGVI